jgi:hypothetical protein
VLVVVSVLVSVLVVSGVVLVPVLVVSGAVLVPVLVVSGAVLVPVLVVCGVVSVVEVFVSVLDGEVGGVVFVPILLLGGITNCIVNIGDRPVFVLVVDVALVGLLIGDGAGLIVGVMLVGLGTDVGGVGTVILLLTVVGTVCVLNLK